MSLSTVLLVAGPGTTYFVFTLDHSQSLLSCMVGRQSNLSQHSTSSILRQRRTLLGREGPREANVGVKL